MSVGRGRIEIMCYCIVRNGRKRGGKYGRGSGESGCGMRSG